MGKVKTGYPKAVMLLLPFLLLYVFGDILAKGRGEAGSSDFVVVFITIYLMLLVMGKLMKRIDEKER